MELAIIDSIQNRLEPFRKCIAPHRRFVSIKKALIEYIFSSGGEALIFVYGPSGAGKTTLLKEILNEILELLQEYLKKNPGIFPYLRVECPTVGTGWFDWADFYYRILKAGGEPMIELKVLKSGEAPLNGESRTASVRRRAVEDMFHIRRPPVLFIDEAQHLNTIGRGMTLEGHMNTIKSLVNMSRTKTVMIGDYNLLKLRNLSGQLSNRSHEFHFARYHFDNKKEIAEFGGILRYLAKHTPFEKTPDLVRHEKTCYEACMGCTGTLKKMLTRACEIGLHKESETIAIEHLQKATLSLAQRIKMIGEINEGEAQLKETLEMEKIYKAALYPSKKEKLKDMDGDEKTILKPISRKKRQPFQRKPRNFPVHQIGNMHIKMISDSLSCAG